MAAIQTTYILKEHQILAMGTVKGFHRGPDVCEDLARDAENLRPET
jgi:hypothetical protein